MVTEEEKQKTPEFRVGQTVSQWYADTYVGTFTILEVEEIAGDFYYYIDNTMDCDAIHESNLLAVLED